MSLFCLYFFFLVSNHLLWHMRIHGIIDERMHQFSLKMLWYVKHISNQVLLDCVDCELIEAFFGLTGSGGGF